MNEPSETSRLSERSLRRLQMSVYVFLILSLVGGIAGAWIGVYKRFNPDPPFVQSARVTDDPWALTTHVRINGTDLWIPAAYFHSIMPQGVEQSDVLLQSMYPDFEPLKERPRKLWERGEWYRNVRWLIRDASVMITVERMIENTQKTYYATAPLGIEYGLMHYTQPPGLQRTTEFWLEGSTLHSVKSLISCSKKYNEISHPHCTHYVWDDGLFYQLSYNKKLLPYWLEIREGVLALTEDFKRDPSSKNAAHKKKGI